MDNQSKNGFKVLQHLTVQFEAYRNKQFLFCISELEIRNQLLLIFTKLRAKHLNFLNSKEDLILETIESSREKIEDRYSLCILTFHHRRYNSPSIVASVLQAVRNNIQKKSKPIPTLVLAQDQEAVFAQFGNTADIRSTTLRAAAKNGLKGIIVGNLEDPRTQKALVSKMVEVVEDDIITKMSPVEQKIRNLINTAYSYLNRMFWSDAEKEENVKKAIDIFEEVLEESQNHYDAMLGKAIAASRSSDPALICSATQLFEVVMDAGKDVERTYEGHAGCCYRLAEQSMTSQKKNKWLSKGVETLKSLNNFYEVEIDSIKKFQQDYKDPDVSLRLSGGYSRIAKTLMQIDEGNIQEAIEANLKGIEHDKSVVENYDVVKLLKKTAKNKEDHLKIAQICSSGREHVPGKEIDYLVEEAEAFSKAGKHLESTKIFNSINQYVDKARLDKWVKYKNGQVIVDDKESKQIAMFISFLNHRAIHFR